MSPWKITTSNGVTVNLNPSTGAVTATCSTDRGPHEDAVGRVVDGAFQPVTLDTGGLHPETLRAIAYLVERAS